MKKLVRKNILNITPYVAGKPIEEAKREFRTKEIIKLASNENPLGPSPKATEAIRKSLSTINRYPDSQAFFLKRKLAKSLRVKPSNIVLGNGSDEIIDIIIKTFVEENENIITAQTTFLEYKIISEVNGRRVITVPLKNFRYDLEAIKKALTRRTKLIFISNPNNPTGTYVSKIELQDFMEDLPDRVLLVLDEAYDAFIDVDDFPDSLNYIDRGNVIVLKTFSKTWGLAGLRIGYAIAREEFTFYMERARQPFNVNSLAQIAAAAAIDDKEFLSLTRKTVLDGKNYIYGALRGLGIAYVPSVANFILINVRIDALTVFRQMLKYGVIVRDMDQYGLKNFIRVTIGTKKENEKFIEVLKKVISKGR